jgi:hypothetical protein
MALRLPRPLRGQCAKAAVKKKGGFARGGKIKRNMNLRLPRPLGGHCAKAAVKKKDGFGKGGHIRGIWP